MNQTRTKGILVPLYLLLIVVVLYAAFHARAYDDPYITYRYAENLRSGVGLVYNPGERVLSTTTPLYALLLALLGFLVQDIPRLSNLISLIGLAVGAYSLYRLGHAWREPVVGLVGALMLPLSALMISTLGAETCFYVMLTLGAFALEAEQRHSWALFLAGLATLTRGDGVLIVVVLVSLYLIRHRRLPWAPILVFVLTIGPWYLFSWMYYGSPFPVTLAAKHQQGLMTISRSFAGGLCDLVMTRLANWRLWPAAALLVMGWIYAFVKARQWLSLLSWAVLYFVGYTVLGVSRYFWYYAPLVPIAVVGVGLGIALLCRWCEAALPLRYQRVLCIILLSLVLLPQARSVMRLSRQVDPRAAIYRDVGVWLGENSPPDARVGTLEVGIIGYYARRSMVDFAGLIQPDVAQQMREDTTYADTALWAIERYRPGYLVIDPASFPEPVVSAVERACVVRQAFEEQSYAGQLLVFECHYGYQPPICDPQGESMVSCHRIMLW